MKKTLLFVSVFALGTTYAQNCSDLFISEYVEGSGNDKAIEIYNPTGAAINLTGYRLERFSNGEATSAAGGVLNLSGSIDAYSTFVIVNGVGVTSTATGSSPAASPALQAMADLLDVPYPAPTFMNGNDAIALFNGATMIDLMGKIGDAGMVSGQSWSDAFPYDGSAGAWWTKDQTLIRKASVKVGVSVNPDPFIVTAEWDSLPKDTWTQLGQHTCDCLLGLNEMPKTVSFAVYPNPTSNGTVIISASEDIEYVEVVNMLGQVVLTADVKELIKTTSLNTTSLTKGIYTVRLRFTNKSASQTSLVIQ
jgi:hypothetical protein